MGQNDFLASLDEEIGRLESAISHIPEVKKLRELKSLRVLYEHGRSNAFAAAGYIPPVEQPKPSGRKPSPERQEALRRIEQLLAKQRKPVKTTDLLAILKQEGVRIGGNDEISNLSAMISASGRFKAHGRSGWTLKTPMETVGDQSGG